MSYLLHLLDKQKLAFLYSFSLVAPCRAKRAAVYKTKYKVKENESVQSSHYTFRMLNNKSDLIRKIFSN